MHALIVIAHHDPQSLTHNIALQAAAGLTAAGHTSKSPTSPPKASTRATPLPIT